MRKLWNLFREVLDVLPADARRFLVRYSIGLGALSILDALALTVLAVTITPIATGRPLVLPVFGKVDQLGLIFLLGAVCGFIILKSVLAVTLLWAATRKFATYELLIGSRLFNGYIQAPWVERLKRNAADLVRMTDSSVGLTISSFLLPASTLLGEFMSFAVILLVLAIAQPLIALTAVIYLGIVGFVLSIAVTRRSRQAGRVNIKYTQTTSRLVTEMIGALKEVTLRNKTDEIAQVVQENRVHTSRARSNIQFLAQIPRYVLESAIIGGFLLVGVVGYLSGGTAAAVTAVALFGLAGFRMAPSIVRFQAIISQVTAYSPHAEAVVREIQAAEKSVEYLQDRDSKPLPTKPATLDFSNVGFAYAADAPEAVSDVTLSIPFGTAVSFVGSSGAGKSTIIDLILGLVEPTRGAITIDGTPLEELTNAWRSHVGYVPQDVALFDASLGQNVALSWTGEYDRDLVRECLAKAQLLDLVDSREGGLDAPVGERGLALSGGQRQRLGIARALYSQPLVLVMDEATSALDTTTEAAVTSAIRGLHGKTTVVTVAHRLATIQHSDVIFFMSHGKVEAAGKFDELVARVPEFALQARLAGLTGEAL
jgi:ABC-type multidrug transport system fused ATPase/permease subunit